MQRTAATCAASAFGNLPFRIYDPTEPFEVKRGERIAQLVVQRVEEVAWQEVESLDGNDRGGGFGHSGRH